MRTPPSSRHIWTIVAVLGVTCALAALSATAALARSSYGTWRRLDVGSTKPGPRRHSTMVYDAANKRVIMFGGDRTTTDMVVYNDLWALELDCGAGKPRWVQLQAQDTLISCTDLSRPCRRHGHAAALVPGTPNRMFVHGGKNAAGVLLDDTWVLSLGATPTWTRRSLSIPGAVDRYHHAAVFYGTRFRFFGGVDAIEMAGMADTWSMDVNGSTWYHVSGNTAAQGDPCHPFGVPCPAPVPDRRYWHSLIVDAANYSMVVFGGVYAADPSFTSNAWQSSNGGSSWARLDPVPVGLSRFLHTAVYDPIGQRMVVVGGYDPRFFCSEGCIGDPDTPGGPETVDAVTALSLPPGGNGTWSTLAPAGTGPGQIAEHAAVYDSDGDRIIVFGGVDENGSYQNDVWVLEFDDTAPAAVANLDVHRYFTSAVTFDWNAPGDDGNSGTACSYEIRYSTNAITDDASFAAATLCSSPPTPSAAGVQDTVKITGLSATGLYYVALKTWDESNNRSALSNVTCARIGPPHLVCDGSGLAPSPLGTPEGSGGNLEFALRTPMPNPSPGPPDVSFSLAQRGAATLELLDLAGRRLAEIDLGVMEPGEHSAHLAAGMALAPGYYLIRLRQARAVLTRPVMIVR